MARKKPGLGERLRKYAESSVMPQGMRLLPRMELTGRGEVLVERHRGILEYSSGRVLVLTADAMLEIEGEALKIAEMNGNLLRVTGKIAGIRVLDI